MAVKQVEQARGGADQPRDTGTPVLWHLKVSHYNEKVRWALDYTAQQSSGIVAWRRDTDHIEKAFVFAGMPARNGVTSALVVRSGWNGVDDIFSGADNFFIAYAPKAQPERLVDKLGERYEVVQTDIKNIAGATLSCEHVTAGVRWLVALWQVALRPAMASGG